MESTNVLSATSLFCSRRNWSLLLKSIQYFNKTIYKKTSYSIEFNYLSDENIRFSFLVHKKTANHLLEQTDGYFKDFFRQLKPEERRQNGEIFKRFDQNTIYYGLYPPVPVKRSEKKNYRLHFMLSKLMIDALKDENHLNDDTILTLAYYFTITVIKVSAEKQVAAKKKVFKTHFREQYRHLKVLEDKVMELKFKENRATLLEVYNSLNEDDAPRWIKKWKSFLSKFLNSENKEADLQTIQVVQQIAVQLGLNSAMKSILCYFIFQVLSSEKVN